ncbi:MAG: S-layer homology domain-containing protein, partial [Eubacteriales bacterium]|nr:S-layer homology domain-containing protein [Eubacteriales bacterium]
GGGGGSSKTTPTIVTKIETGENVTGTNVDNLVKEGKNLTVEGKAGEKLVFDTEALKTIDNQTKDSVKVEIKDVSADYKNEHPDRLIVSLTITAGGKHIKSFGNGTATVSLPYELKEGEKAADVTVWYLAEDGTMSEVPCSYDPATKLATFKVNHFSLYVVGTADTSKWTNSFRDVKESNWFYDGVRYVSANGLMQGTTKTAFSPNAKITRSMLVTILWRMENQPTVAKTTSFTDVPAGKWYTDAVAWAAANNIAAGYAGKFDPNAPLTREQLASILHRYATYKNYDIGKVGSLTAYADKPSAWALSSVSWAVAEGLLKGSNGNLDPKGSATRAQTASILQRFMENTAK